MAVVCLLHGAWHDASCWDRVATALRARGHRVIAPDLPLHDPGASYDQRVRPALEALDGLEALGRVDPADGLAVVGHSMGASYAPLVAAARPGALVVGLCPGLGPLREGFPWPPDRADGTSVWLPADARAVLYPRLPPDLARRWADQLRPMALAPDRYPLRRPRREALPTVNVCATDDELFDIVSERAKAAARPGAGYVEIPGGHFPMLGAPDMLAAVLDQVLRGGHRVPA